METTVTVTGVAPIALFPSGTQEALTLINNGAVTVFASETNVTGAGHPIASDNSIEWRAGTPLYLSVAVPATSSPVFVTTASTTLPPTSISVSGDLNATITGPVEISSISGAVAVSAIASNVTVQSALTVLYDGAPTGSMNLNGLAAYESIGITCTTAAGAPSDVMTLQWRSSGGAVVGEDQYGYYGSSAYKVVRTIVDIIADVCAIAWTTVPTHVIIVGYGNRVASSHSFDGALPLSDGSFSFQSPIIQVNTTWLITIPVRSGAFTFSGRFQASTNTNQGVVVSVEHINSAMPYGHARVAGPSSFDVFGFTGVLPRAAARLRVGNLTTVPQTLEGSIVYGP